MYRCITAVFVFVFCFTAAVPLQAQFTVIQDLDPFSSALNMMNIIPRTVLPGTTPKLMFPVKTSSTGLTQIYVYNGSAFPLVANPSAFMQHNSAAGSVMYYQGLTGFYTGGQPWVTDGSAGGTYQLMTVQSSCGYLSDVVARTINNITYLSYGAVKCKGTGTAGMDAYLYKTNGTSGGTVKLKSWSSTSGAITAYYHALGSWCLFYYGGGSSRALYRTDGTSKGTTVVKAITAMYTPVVAGGYSIFPANDGVNGIELWRSNATATGTTMVSNLAPGSASSTPDFLTVLGSYVYFAANDGTGGKLYRYDPVLNQSTVISMDASDPKWLTVMDGKLYFSAVTAADGRELWVYNPSTGIANLVANIASGTLSGDPHYGGPLPTGIPNMYDHDRFFAVFNGYMYFAAKNSTSNYTLWRSNGITVEEVVGAGVTLPNCFTVMGSKLYYIGYDEVYGFRLYAFDPSQYTPPTPKSLASAVPTEITLGQNYPNPFNPSTVISYSLPQEGVVTLLVTDMLGREVARLVDGERRSAGTHSVSFDARDLPSGLYLYRLETGGAVMVRKMVLMR